MTRYVFDSYAMLAAYWSEPGHIRVHQLFADQQHERWMSLINLGELYYLVAKQEGLSSAEYALAWIDRFQLRFVNAQWMSIYAAARLKAQYALSYADCFAAALAQQLDASVVTGDPEFAQLEQAGIISVEWLPSKPRTSR